jgi:hypothetical protein
MKILLACLMCLVLCTSECFALKGGPPYPVGTDINGSYAGVLVPPFDPTNPLASNSLGIFSLRVPSTGNATGTFVMFAQGRTFTGTLDGTGDPNHGNIRAILHASFNYTLSFVDSTGVLRSVDVTASVNGNMNAQVRSTPSNFFQSSAAVLRGEANMFIDQGGVGSSGIPVLTGALSLLVDGFKQSSSVGTNAGG